jgi:NAD(P)-dependent dehydrogenase (short-subunit alcohol dehydrogenase family)
MKQKVALITAAGSGMGAECARALASAGWRVAVSSSSGRGEALGRELGGLGFTASNTDPEALARVVQGTLAAYGRIDAVVNSCGGIPYGDLLAIPDADWHAGLDMVLLSVIRIARLNISSFAAVEPNLTYPVSSALRSALSGFTKMYAERYAATHIRMNNVLPGFVLTKTESEAVKERVPMHRYGSAAEIAGTVLFLLSDAAAYITGQNIRIDGGLSRSL